jgi:hypothetical protein
MRAAGADHVTAVTAHIYRNSKISTQPANASHLAITGMPVIPMLTFSG